MTSEAFLKELERIRMNHGGILYPHDVVKEAADADNPLHNSFEWDNEKAGHEHRLWQARQIIRITVEAPKDLPEGKPIVLVPRYISLKEDREKDGGYLLLSDVLADKRLREKLLSDAKGDMRFFTRKYEKLNELVQVFESMKEVLQTI